MSILQYCWKKTLLLLIAIVFIVNLPFLLFNGLLSTVCQLLDLTIDWLIMQEASIACPDTERHPEPTAATVFDQIRDIPEHCDDCDDDDVYEAPSDITRGRAKDVVDVLHIYGLRQLSARYISPGGITIRIVGDMLDRRAEIDVYNDGDMIILLHSKTELEFLEAADGEVLGVKQARIIKDFLTVATQQPGDDNGS